MDGLGDLRRLGFNRFRITEGRCWFSEQKVFEDGVIYVKNLRAVEVRGRALQGGGSEGGV